MAEKSRNWKAVLDTLHQSDRLNRVSEGAEVLYRRLLEVCDNGGNYFADPALLLGYVFAHRMSMGLTPKDMLDRTEELVRVGLVEVYAEGKLLHISRHYTRLRSDGHGADIRFASFPGKTDTRPDSDRTPPGVHPASTRRPQSRDRVRGESEESEKRVRICADDSKSSAPSGANQPAASRTRTFRERLVDGCLLAFGKRYAKTRGQEYPGGLPALREAGFGIVTKRLKTLCPDVPYRKAAEAGMTTEQIESLCKDALKVWGGYLDRAAQIHETAKGIPGKDGDWLRFPDTVAKFCGRIPKLTDTDVQAAGKRAADVAEAKRNQKRMNPDTGSTIRYGEKENVIP